MSAYISQVGLATTALVANQVSLLATYKERLCKYYCTDSSHQPSVSVTYSNDAAVMAGSTIFVPVVASVNVTIPKRCGCSSSQTFTEKFYVAFQGQTALPTAVTIASDGRINAARNTKCCKTNEIAIEDSLIVSITTA